MLFLKTLSDTDHLQNKNNFAMVKTSNIFYRGNYEEKLYFLRIGTAKIFNKHDSSNLKYTLQVC